MGAGDRKEPSKGAQQEQREGRGAGGVVLLVPVRDAIGNQTFITALKNPQNKAAS